MVKSLLYIWNICPPISRMIKYKEIKHKAFGPSKDARILRLKEKTLKTKTTESVLQNRNLNKTKLRRKKLSYIHHQTFATGSTGKKKESSQYWNPSLCYLYDVKKNLSLWEARSVCRYSLRKLKGVGGNSSLMGSFWIHCTAKWPRTMFLKMKNSFTRDHPEYLQEIIIPLGFSPVFLVGISLREWEAFMKILHAPMLWKVRNNMIVPPQQPLRS